MTSPASLISVRTATAEDLPKIQALLQSLGEHEAGFVAGARTDFSYSQEGIDYIQGRIQSPDGYLGLALNGSDPVGLLIGVRDAADPGWVRLEDFYTDPCVRGGGFGKAVFLDFVAWAERSNASRVTVAVAEGNKDTWAIYLKLGFAEIERRGHAVILELKNNASAGSQGSESNALPSD